MGRLHYQIAMNIVFPIIELVDRLTIARLKFIKTQANLAELEFYEQQAKNLDIDKIADELQQLMYVHGQIWQLEYLIKVGCEEQLSLEEIGRRALQVRDLNNQRIKLKNRIAEIFQDSVREIKQDHLSQ